MDNTTHKVPGAAANSPDDGLRLTRRRLLALLATFLSAAGLAPPAIQELAEAKKKSNGKKKRKRKKKRKGGCTRNPNASYTPDSEERALVDLINAFRRQNGRSELAIHERLSAAAKTHSQDMATKNYFRHTLANGADPGENILCHGYSYSRYGENIAAGYERARDTFDQWEGSPEHRRIMLGENFTEIGIGRAHNARAKYDWYWTGTFGSR